MQGAGRWVRLRETPTPKSSRDNAAGQDLYVGTMILALAVRHRAERPAIRMEGGTLTLWSGLVRRRLNCL